MKAIFQTKLFAAESAHRGNCLPAAIASILECSLWMVPEFAELRGVGFSDALHAWAKLIGRRFVNVGGHPVEDLPEFYIANGASPRGVAHSVVYSKGVLAHDPHPLGGGIKEVECCWYFE